MISRNISTGVWITLLYKHNITKYNMTIYVIKYSTNTSIIIGIFDFGVCIIYLRHEKQKCVVKSDFILNNSHGRFIYPRCACERHEKLTRIHNIMMDVQLLWNVLEVTAVIHLEWIQYEHVICYKYVRMPKV